MSWIVTRYGLGIHIGTAFNGMWNRSAEKRLRNNVKPSWAKPGLLFFAYTAISKLEGSSANSGTAGASVISVYWFLLSSLASERTRFRM